MNPPASPSGGLDPVPGPDGISIVPVEGRAMLDRFIRLPDALLASDPAYVPPLHAERRAALTSGGNPFFRHAEAAFWLATRDGRDVGRISAQRDRLIPDPTLGQFGMLSAVDDAAVFARLLRTAEDWLAARGADRAQGPYNLSINEETGLLVDGHDSPPMMMMPHDPPYAGARLEQAGYRGVRDLYAYLCDFDARLPQAAGALVARGLPAGVTLRPMRKRDLSTEIATLVSIYNDAWSGNWGFVPITEAEVAHMARALKPLLHERLVWFAESHGEPVAFVLCLPNLNEAIRDLSGRLFPFNWARLLWRLRRGRIETARVPLMGVRGALAGGMLGRLLALHLVEAIRRESVAMGIRAAEMSWVLDDNLPMRHLAEAIGGRAYKTYRIFEKPLPGATHAATGTGAQQGRHA